MIVIGVDVHKQSLTAVAVDEVGRQLAETTRRHGRAARLVGSLAGERLWAVEDCRQLTRALERRLLAAGEQLVRVPPKLMAPQRRAAGRAASRTRSTRSRSRGRPCANRGSTGRGRARSRCAS